MLGAKVNLEEAEKLKKELIKKELLARDFKPKKEKDFLIFPLTKNAAFSGYKSLSQIDYEFEKKADPYKEFLKREGLPKSYDILGNILILDIPENLIKEEKDIAKALIHTNKNVKTVLKKSGMHSGEFRTQKLTYIYGEKTKETVYKENNVLIRLDVEKVYFSPRLSTERKRIFHTVKPHENILVMFSGCGPYPLTISKNTSAKSILGVEKNKVAHEYAVQNIELNKLTNISLINDDVRNLEGIGVFDRIIMPLPKDADLFLDVAFRFIKKGTIIHLYGFEHESSVDNIVKKIDVAAKKDKIKYGVIKVVKCGQYSPGMFRVCADFRIL